jgi:cysteinyl-tRNA synthetase
MLTLNGQKMAKSTGNNILPEEMFSGENSIFTNPFSPEVVRFFLLQSHYRSIVDLSEDALLASEKGYNKLKEGYLLLTQLTSSTKTEGFDIAQWEDLCYKAMSDDFNSPMLIAQLFEAIRFINSVNNGSASISKSDQLKLVEKMKNFIEDIMGISFGKSKKSDSNTALEGTVNMLIDFRKIARDNKDFQTSDRIRDELSGLGIQLKDEKDGTSFII